MEEAARMANQATTLFEEGRFRWTKWSTNDPGLRPQLPNGGPDAKADEALGMVLGGEGDTKLTLQRDRLGEQLKSTKVSVSFIEIYNKVIFDLLTPKNDVEKLMFLQLFTFYFNAST